MASPLPVIRDLPPDEWDRLADFEPFASYGGTMPPPDAPWRFLTAEDPTSGEILGYCALYTAVHWEPWVIRPEHQKRPGLVRGLIRKGLEVLAESDAKVAYALADEDGAPLVEHFGFQPAPSRLYIVAVDQIRV